MTSLTQRLHQVQQRGHRVARSAQSWIEPIARFGYAAKGTVSCLIGLLAILAAIGLSQGLADQRGVMTTLLAQPFGKLLLLAMAVGLASYALWNLIQAILDPDRAGADFNGLAKRLGHFFKALINAALVLAILRLLIGLRTDDSTDSAARDWTAYVMTFPLGIWLVAATGLGILGYGLYQIYRAWKIKLDDQLDLYRLKTPTRKFFIFLSRFGLFARGILFGTIGLFLVIAAMRTNPREAKGIAAAMRALEQQPYGSLLLCAVALGLISYGFYQFLRAKYRRIGP
ncbi:MAG TPA: DUF1206 domain-containing protein [Tepidisphaeraceae bacterium]|nr:DUF1206 domain-containing protein [Tepidisphaeraceae bacterium]